MSDLEDLLGSLMRQLREDGGEWISAQRATALAEGRKPVWDLVDEVHAPASLLWTRAVCRRVTEADLAAVTRLETDSYPADEAATPEKLQYRVAHAPHLFRVLEVVGVDGAAIVGFICGTSVAGERVTEASMSAHDPRGESVVIHSVVTDSRFRRRGLAKFMMRQYIRALAEERAAAVAVSADAATFPYRRVLLITHEENAPLYASCGFTMVGPSEVHHGSRPWLEMAHELTAQAATPRVFHINAFSIEPSVAAPSPVESGNPACVVLLRVRPHEVSAEATTLAFPRADRMAAFAAQMALPATAFVAPRIDGRFSIRFFTPAGEIPLCGHASLAAGHVLDRCGMLPHESLLPAVSLVTASGREVQLRRLPADAAGAPPSSAASTPAPSCAAAPEASVSVHGCYELRLGAAPPDVTSTAELLARDPDGLADLQRAVSVLGLPDVDGMASPGSDGFGILGMGRNANNDVTIIMTPRAFAAAQPRPADVQRLGFPDARIVSITAAGRWGCSPAADAGRPDFGVWAGSTPDSVAAASGFCASPASGSAAVDAAASSMHRLYRAADIVSRCFNASGEDPVCGAAHAGIVPFWAAAAASCTASHASPSGGAGSSDSAAAEAASVSLLVFQSSPRGGLMHCRYEPAAGAGCEASVLLAGRADTFMSGGLEGGGAEMLGL